MSEEPRLSITSVNDTFLVDHVETSSQIELNDVESKAIREIERPIPPPDSRFGWIVVLAAFSIHFVALGFLYSFGIVLSRDIFCDHYGLILNFIVLGVFLVPLQEEFDVGRGSVSWIGSTANGTVRSPFLLLFPFYSCLFY